MEGIRNRGEKAPTSTSLQAEGGNYYTAIIVKDGVLYQTWGNCPERTLAGLPILTDRHGPLTFRPHDLAIFLGGEVVGKILKLAGCKCQEDTSECPLHTDIDFNG
jgi:hypothetical protein